MRYPRYPAYRDFDGAWMDRIPAHWDTQKLKHVSTVEFSNVDKHKKAGEVPVRLCNYVDVYYNDYITPDIDFMEATASPDEIRHYRLRESDVIITKDSETWDDIAVPAYVPADLDGVLCGYHLAMIRPDSDVVDGEYLFRAFSARGINDQFKVAATGITRYGLGKHWLEDSLFPMPPLPEQRAIADFLDRETTRIDRLVRKQERLIELLEEKRAALISHAVTKGLDPDASMKSSSVGWIGQVPEDWEVAKIRRLCSVKRGASPRPIDDPIYFDDGGDYAWVRISDVTASDKYLVKTEQQLSPLGKSKSVPLEPGRLFLSIAATVGKPIITKIKCCIHDGFVYFEGLRENKEYLYYVLSTAEIYKGHGKLGTQLNLNTDTVGDFYIPIPPPARQSAIVAHLDREVPKIDALIDDVQGMTGLLQEYRTALISEAVTGKIDVREEVPPA